MRKLDELRSAPDFAEPVEVNLGDTLVICDNLDYSETKSGTVIFIENDNDFIGLKWYYLRALDESLNVNYDNRILNNAGIPKSFWKLIANTDKHIINHIAYN